MKIEDVDEDKLRKGEYCRKRSATTRCPICFCAIGWTYEYMCPDCRDGREPGDDDSYCIRPPKEIRVGMEEEESDAQNIV